jgi:hypothetical protein
LVIPVTPKLLIALRRDANRAMWQEWRAAHPPGKRVYEVACIRNLVEKALPRVQQAWKPTLGALGISVTLTGVMCHGRPFVSFPGAARSCELGDLLLVHDHQPGQGALERRAAVIQAKVFGRSGVTSRNDIQLALYQRWPQFTYTDWPDGLGALKAVLESHQLAGPDLFDRHIARAVPGHSTRTAATVDAGCRYGMIDTASNPWGDPYLSMNPWRLCSPNEPDLYHYHWGLSLGGYLVRLVMGKVGRPALVPGWPSTLSGACHWSLMVEELMALLPSANPPPAASPGTPAASGKAAPRGALALMVGNTPPAGSGGAPPGLRDQRIADEAEHSLLFW